MSNHLQDTHNDKAERWSIEILQYNKLPNISASCT